MYIRKSQQKHPNTGAVYDTYRLVESYRNSEGKVRQQTLFNLGSNFSIPQTQWKTLADRIEEIQRGQQTLFPLDHALEKEAERIAKLLIKRSSDILVQIKATPTAIYQSVDVHSLEHNDVRKIGAEHVAVEAANLIRLGEILSSLGFTERQRQTAVASIVSRLVHPGSELNTHRYLTRDSALDELLRTDFSNIGLQNLYKVSDQLLKHKESIEQALYQHEKDIFQFQEMITLYDLTNTYFEGQQSQNPKKQYGRSKEKRSDCCLVALGMVLDASGFPKRSKIYPGNVSEPKTLKEMLCMLSDNKEAIVVMDAGIATEDNVTWLQNEGYHYIVVSRRRHLVMPENQETIVVKEARNNLVEAVLINNNTTNELELYCHSQAKEAKSKVMVSKASERYEDELKKLVDGLNKKGCTKKYEKIVERIGRLKEKYRKVGQLYEINIQTDLERTYVTNITWERNEDKAETKQSGIYCLRTNQKDLDAKTLWEVYTTLTDLESAFRSLKSELGMRPIYHQKETRIDGHLFISILAYHLLHTIRYQLKAKGIYSSWQTLREILATHSRITSTMKLENGGILKIRKTTSPNADQAAIYQALNIASHPAKTETAYL